MNEENPVRLCTCYRIFQLIWLIGKAFDKDYITPEQTDLTEPDLIYW